MHCTVGVDRTRNGVGIAVHSTDRSVWASVAYTPAIARQIAHDILVAAEVAEALGGPTDDLVESCSAGRPDRGQS